MVRQNGNIREQIDRRRFGRRMKQALRRVLIGESYRAAAAAEGIDHADLWKAATSITGLCEEHLRAWRNRWGDEFPGSLGRLASGTGRLNRENLSRPSLVTADFSKLGWGLTRWKRFFGSTFRERPHVSATVSFVPMPDGAFGLGSFD